MITRERLNIIYKWAIFPMFNCLLGNADAWLISRQWIAAEGIPFVPSSVWGSSGTPWSAEDLASIACFWMGKMKLETETNGLCHGFGGTMVPYGAQSNFGGRSKEAHPPKPMPSFASDISARRSSWLTISIYLPNFDMYIFIHINEMCVYIYIHTYMCVCVYPFWIVIARNLYHSSLVSSHFAQIMNQQNWEAMGPLLDKASHFPHDLFPLRWWIGSRLMDWFFSICIAPSIEFHCWNPSSRIQVGNQESNLIIQLEMSSKTQVKKTSISTSAQIVPSSNSCARSRRSNRSTCSSPFVPPGPCCQSSRALGWPRAKPWRVWGATNSCPGSTVSHH